MKKIRRAQPTDAKGIHEAHMRSIREICAKDHSTEEINAWGYRPFREDHRLNAIANQFVWVVDSDGSVEGYGHLGLETKDYKSVAHIHGLYLAPEAIGLGLGHKIVTAMINEAKEKGAKEIVLESTLTAHKFYQRVGFKDIGPQMKVSIGGVDIRCIPMSMQL
jgi:putative acetyltransferase